MPNVAIQPTGWCLGSFGIQQLPLWQANPILSLNIGPLKDRLLPLPAYEPTALEL